MIFASNVLFFFQLGQAARVDLACAQLSFKSSNVAFSRRTHRYHSGRYIRRREAALPEAVPLHSFRMDLYLERGCSCASSRSGIRSARLSGCFPLHPSRGGSGNCRFCNRREPSILYFHSAAQLRFCCQPVDTAPAFSSATAFHLQCRFCSICASRSAFAAIASSYSRPMPVWIASLFRNFFFPIYTPAARRSGFIKTLSSGTQSVSGFVHSQPVPGSGRKNVTVISFCPIVSSCRYHSCTCMPCSESVISKFRCKQ